MKKNKLYIFVIMAVIILLLIFIFEYEKGVKIGTWGVNRSIKWG